MHKPLLEAHLYGAKGSKEARKLKLNKNPNLFKRKMGLDGNYKKEGMA